MTDQPPRNGIGCPACGCNDSEVVKTRTWFGQISRRRACRACGQRWSTIERPVVKPSTPPILSVPPPPPDILIVPADRPDVVPDLLPASPKPRRPRGKKMQSKK